MKVRYLSYPQMIRDFIRDEVIMRYINIQICPDCICRQTGEYDGCGRDECFFYACV